MLSSDTVGVAYTVLYGPESSESSHFHFQVLCDKCCTCIFLCLKFPRNWWRGVWRNVGTDKRRLCHFFCRFSGKIHVLLCADISPILFNHNSEYINEKVLNWSVIHPELMKFYIICSILQPQHILITPRKPTGIRNNFFFVYCTTFPLIVSCFTSYATQY